MTERARHLAAVGRRVWAWAGVSLFFAGFWFPILVFFAYGGRTIFDWWRPLLPLMFVGSMMLALESRAVSKRALLIVLLVMPVAAALLLMLLLPGG